MTKPPKNSEQRDLIEAALDAPYLQLRMPALLEQRFADEQVWVRFSYLIRSGWLALAIFNGFLLVDWLLVPDVFWQAIFIRVVFFTPIGLIVLLSAHYYVRPNFDKKIVYFLNDYFAMLTAWGAAACLMFILLVSNSGFAHFYIAGILAIIVYGNLVQRLEFRYAIVFTVGLLLISQVGALLNESYRNRINLLLFLLLFVAGLITLVANFVAWKNGKRNYLLRLREEFFIEDLNEANAKLDKVSRSDALTGLFNRRHFNEYLALTWQRARLANEPVTLLMLDVDHFKAFNDHYGHQAGDECLKHIATALTQYLRKPGDLTARYGGEEFVAVLHPTSPDEAHDIAQRVRRIIEDLRMRHERSSVAPVVTVSIGIGVCLPDSNGSSEMSPEQLIDLADKALYIAKNEGRNRVHMLTSGDSVPT